MVVLKTLKSAVAAIGESSKIFCGICMDRKSVEEMFSIKNCSHMFCSECVGRYIAAKIQENVVMVGCPDPKCEGSLEPEFCQPIIPAQVFERWSNALFESMIIGSERFYCPYKDCSMLMADDGGENVTESECPNCHRLFCAQCKVPWHSGIKCEEYQKLNEDERGGNDLQMMELANTKGWKRCPRCRFFVEKTEGCVHVTCRCGTEFCYRCASIWSDTHEGCARLEKKIEVLWNQRATNPVQNIFDVRLPLLLVAPNPGQEADEGGVKTESVLSTVEQRPMIDCGRLGNEKGRGKQRESGGKGKKRGKQEGRNSLISFML